MTANCHPPPLLVSHFAHRSSNRRCRAVGILIAGGWVIGATYWRFHRDVVIDKAGDCYDSGECDSNPVNKLAACGAVVMSYFLGELLIKVRLLLPCHELI